VISGQAVGNATLNGKVDDFHAIRWTATGAVDLNPTDLGEITLSALNDAFGNQQVGFGSVDGTSNHSHALLWNGTAASAVDLNPTDLIGITDSGAGGTNGIQQVGNCSGIGTGNHEHALLWSGTAASAVDLNPTDLIGITDSGAGATDGSQQVGSGYGNGMPSELHALLWTGTAASAVDLNPTNLNGINYSVAYDVGGNQQVGEGDSLPFGIGSGSHALLWTGTAASAVDLNPTNLPGINGSDSTALATNGHQQAGFAFTTDLGVNAIVWTGTAASAVNLDPLLQAMGSWTDSEADYIDSSGNIYGIADGTYHGVTGAFAVEWSPPAQVPEPVAGSLLLITSAGMLMRRKRTEFA
jgi:hypothetical protein